MIDTTLLLQAVAREKTETASLRTLVATLTSTLGDLSGQLKAALDANNGPEMQRIQQDIANTVDGLNLDADATDAAIKANTPAAGAAPVSNTTPPADTAGQNLPAGAVGNTAAP